MFSAGRILFRGCRCGPGQVRQQVRQVQEGAGEYSEHPSYPAIRDISKKGMKRYAELDWHERIRCLPTVEQKLYELNIPRYYGWKCIELPGNFFPYDCLEFIQYATHTHLADGLPDVYGSPELEEKARHWTEKLKGPVMDVLAFEFGSHRRHVSPEAEEIQEEAEFEVSSCVVEEINRVILSHLAPEFSYLQGAEVDYQPRSEAFWFLGSMEPDLLEKRQRKGWQTPKEEFDKKVTRPVQYMGCPLLQVRCEQLLPPFLPRSHSLPPPLPPSSLPPPDPRCHGFHHIHRHGTTVPGFFPGSPCEFGLVSFHPRHYLSGRSQLYGPWADQDLALRAQGVLAGFGWLLGQACYQGFGPYTELTYPLVAQGATTDGARWTFWAYQMNTTLLHGEHALSNPLSNVFWATDDMRLFQEVDAEGKVHGFDDAVLKQLLKFYLNAPAERDGVELKPFLAVDPHVADWEDEDRREAFQKLFKHMYSNRPRTKPKPETYQWEEFYKVRHRTRPQDARRRWFEVGEKPNRKRYDDYEKRYVPKIARKDPKEKWNRLYLTKEQY